MLMTEKLHIDIKEIKKLAKQFNPDQMDACINQQLQEGINVCDITGTTDYIVNELAKAEFVRQMMDKGVSLTDAVRELANRIRSFHQLSK